MLNTSVSGPQLLLLPTPTGRLWEDQGPQQTYSGLGREVCGRARVYDVEHLLQTDSVACWESSSQSFDVSYVLHALLCDLACVAASVTASLLAEGKGSGAVQSLFPWFCLCFQRAFKSFDDVWRLWEVRCTQPGTLDVDCTPPASGGEATQLCQLPFLALDGAQGSRV